MMQREITTNRYSMVLEALKHKCDRGGRFSMAKFRRQWGVQSRFSSAIQELGIVENTGSQTAPRYKWAGDVDTKSAAQTILDKCNEMQDLQRQDIKPVVQMSAPITAADFFNITEQNGQKLVSARELHSFLESGKDFSNWIKHRIEKYGLIEGVDFVVFTQTGENLSGGRPAIEYALTLNAGKELAMVEGNDKGKQARQYFIQCEGIAKSKAPALFAPAPSLPSNPFDVMRTMLDAMEQTSKRVDTMETAVHRLEAKTTTRQDNYFTIAGFAALHHKSVNYSQAKHLGQIASRLCKLKGIRPDKVRDVRFGWVGAYPEEILQGVFQNYFTKSA